TDANLVVLDDRTTDRSAIVARDYGADVVERRFVTFPLQRNAALDVASARHPDSWVFFVDHDERATLALADEITGVVGRSDSDSPVAYWVPRRNIIWGGWIRHGGWSPDYQLRLVRSGKVRYDESRDVHELALLNGSDGYLRERLVHFNYDRVGQFFSKQELYSTLEARRLRREGRRARPQNFVLQPLREFRRRYFELEGYKDGWRGLVLSILLAWYTGETYVKLAIGR
ncbi:MAG TPA: glycosyltransferase family 2 protein, partial [Chloroflexota bacterium]|nr:glycosyltransferase family 2 protein [Chloroflexota bacterium]